MTVNAFERRKRRYGSDTPEAIANRKKHTDAEDSRERMRKERMAAIKLKITLTGSVKQKEALKIAEMGYGWRAVSLASWGHLTDNEAKDLAGEHR